MTRFILRLLVPVLGVVVLAAMLATAAGRARDSAALTAVVQQSDGNNVVYLIDPLTRSILPRSLPYIASADNIFIAPTGRRVAFMTGPDNLNRQFHIYDLLTLEMQTSAGVYNALPFRAPAWSPDGRYLAINVQPEMGGGRRNAGLHIMDFARGTTTTVYDQPIGAGVRWSPPGMQPARLLFRDQATSVVYMVDVNGTDLHPVGASVMDLPVWTLDGDNLLLMQVENAGVMLYAADATGRDLRRLENTTRIYGLGPVPDPEWLAVLDTEARTLFTRSLSTDEAYRIPADAPEPVWAPDGESLLLIVPRIGSWADLYHVARAGGDMRRIAENVIAAGWSEDGRYIDYQAFAGDGSELQLHIQTATGDARLLAAGRLSAVQWSPPGDLLAYIAADDNTAPLSSRIPQRLHVVAVNGDAHYVTPPGHDVFSYAFWE